MVLCLIKGEIPIHSTDQLCVIVLAAADDRAFAFRPMSLGEIMRAQNNLYPYFNKSLESWPEGVVYPITHEKEVHFVTAFYRRLCQLSDRMRILVLGACAQKQSQLFGHFQPLLAGA